MANEEVPGQNQSGRWTHGALVACVALAVLLFALVVIVVVGVRTPSDIAFAMSSFATPVVAIASAYFGIRVAGEAARDAGAAARTGTNAAASAAAAAEGAAHSAQQSAAAAEGARTEAHDMQQKMLRITLPATPDNPDGGAVDVDLNT